MCVCVCVLRRLKVKIQNHVVTSVPIHVVNFHIKAIQNS